ncbi:vicilin-like seed storage protein At2g18540 [Benincasa hispida]|uniref:vicilin-like seed storage protein At2g18540 n=1 Tax=Benincasa hispida TaxID=102211 RepID=UPI0019013BE0|nr:vicilin-like seed storage protein At2g18540 [Benincasa hispida]
MTRRCLGAFLSNLKKGGGLPKAGVVIQPLPTEEVTVEMTEDIEKETRKSTLAFEDPKETVNVDFYGRPSRVALEEMVVETQPEVAEEKKKKKKSKGKKVGEDEPSHHCKAEKKIKEKENEEVEEAKPRKRKERGERKERRREERRLKKEEERKRRAASPEMDGKSTSMREDMGGPAQLRDPVQPKTTQTIALKI